MNIIDTLLSFIAPHDCLVCGHEGSLVCALCCPDALEPIDGLCYRCNQIAETSNLCASCRRDSILQAVWVASAYNEVARQLLYYLKFERAQAAALIIARVLDDSLSYLPPNTIITHIPTANVRVRQRGYDQAQLIARELARLRGLRYQRLLLRHGKSRQVGASRLERAKNLREAYVLRRPITLSDTPIVMVDDVLTTGATIEAAAKVLYKTGSPDICAALFAHKQLDK